MSYKVKEIFYTLQGEGANAGRAAVFCRFAGCNLWTGREQDREDAACTFCDTDFTGTDGPGGGVFASPGELAGRIQQAWPHASGAFVVVTGGEPLLQFDQSLLDELHRLNAEVAIETNGTRPAPEGPGGLDWVCVSPKAGAGLVITRGDELKLVYPQSGAEPEQFEQLDFRHFFLQPMDGPCRDANTRLAVQYCMSHPRWRLSLQTHKFLGIP